MNSKCGVVPIVIVLLILSMSFGAIMYFNNYFEEEKEEEKKEKLFVNIEDDITKEMFLNIYKSNHLENISKLESNIDNFNVLSSDIKLDIVFNSLSKELNDVYASGIDIKYIDDYFKNVFKDTIYYNKTSIICNICKKQLFIYDNSNNKYIYNEEHKYHEMYESVNLYTKVIDIKKKNNIYVVSYSNIWSEPISNKESSYNVYLSYNDAINKINVVSDIEDINSIYDIYKDKMHTYTYTFEKIDDSYKIVSFSYK